MQRCRNLDQIDNLFYLERLLRLSRHGYLYHLLLRFANSAAPLLGKTSVWQKMAEKELDFRANIDYNCAVQKYRGVEQSGSSLGS